MIKPQHHHIYLPYRITNFKDIYSMLLDEETSGNHQAPVVQKVDNAIHRINHYTMDSVVCFVNIYPLHSDLSGG